MMMVYFRFKKIGTIINNWNELPKNVLREPPLFRGLGGKNGKKKKENI